MVIVTVMMFFHVQIYLFFLKIKTFYLTLHRREGNLLKKHYGIYVSRGLR